MTNQTFHQKYRPDIDGLRALAIIAVIGYHAFPERLSGGFVGVDIFFIISGFLISKIIKETLEKNNFSIANFYDRRIRRIFPSLLIVMATTLIFGWAVLLPDEYQQLGKHVVGGASFIQNFILLNEVSYFDNSAETKPLLHLWSLAVEEQFYIFWPLILAAIYKRNLPFIKLALTIGALSFFTNIFLANNDQASAYYSPFSRFWELIAGGILAHTIDNDTQAPPKQNNTLSIFGISLIILGFSLINKHSTFPGWWALFPTTGAYLIILSGQKSWFNEKILSSKLFIFIGLISYPLYLWHWVTLSFLHIFSPPTSTAKYYKIAAIIFSVVLAYLTVKFIETKIRFSRNNFVLIGLTLSMTVLGISGWLVADGIISPRNTQFKIASISNEWEFLKENGKNSDWDEKIATFGNNNNKTTVFIGDSHVAQYALRISNLQKNNPHTNFAIFAVTSNCIPIPRVVVPSRPACSKTRERGFDIAKGNNVSNVVIGGAWNYYFIEDLGNYINDKGQKININSNIGIEAALKSLANNISELKDKNIYLLLDNPTGDIFNPRTLIAKARIFNDAKIPHNQKISEIQYLIRERLIRFATENKLKIIDPYDGLCTNKVCKTMDENSSFIFKESSHLSPEWVREHGNWIDSTMF